MTLDDALLAFCRLTERFEGIPPTVREFESAIGAKTPSHALYWLTKLDAAGWTYVPVALRRPLGAYGGSRTHQLSAEGWSRARALQAVSA